MTDEDYVRLALDVARKARADGNHPFGAILVGPDGSVLMESGNTHGDTGDRTGHAERVLMTQASLAYDVGFLSGCTMAVSAEPLSGVPERAWPTATTLARLAAHAWRQGPDALRDPEPIYLRGPTIAPPAKRH